jgi:hypothetical protein
MLIVVVTLLPANTISEAGVADIMIEDGWSEESVAPPPQALNEKQQLLTTAARSAALNSGACPAMDLLGAVARINSGR